MIEILKFIYKHPLNKKNQLKAMWKFFKWQISSRLWDGALIFNWIDDSKLIVKNGMTGATGNIYVGLMEYEDMSFLLHYLQKDDLFFDIGANVGVYTVLASKVREARTICFEPIPNTYEKLLDNLQINRLDNVIAENIGLSYEKSKLHFITDKDTMNSVALSTDIHTQEVDVDTLENMVQKHGCPKIIKIDVEGYETNVLEGANKVLEEEKLEVLILELNGSGVKFGFSDDEIHSKLLQIDFKPYRYNPFERKLMPLEKYGTHNTIYIKSQSFNKVQSIVQTSKSFECNGMMI